MKSFIFLNKFGVYDGIMLSPWSFIRVRSRVDTDNYLEMTTVRMHTDSAVTPSICPENRKKASSVVRIITGPGNLPGR